MKRINLLWMGVLILASGLYAQTSTWKFDPAHTQIKFTVTHLVISEVTGSFKKFDGKITTTGNDFSNAKVEFTADINSISTDNERRDNHLKSDDFFNAQKFSQMKFVSQSMVKADDNKYKLTGDLTIRDITKPVTLDVTYNGMVTVMGATHAGFKLIGKINRFDYDLKWNALIETGGAVVGKEVTITCDIDLIKSS
jgi:polyisoprenoid-binding protein YceI